MEHRFSNIKLGTLWLFFSGFYLTQLTPISPVYIAFFFFTGLIAMNALLNKVIYLNVGVLITIPMVVYLTFGFLNAEFNIVTNFIISLLSAFITYNLFNKKYMNSRLVLLSFFLYAVLFNFDGVWRLLNPELDNLDKLVSLGVGFQIYKYNSVMYSDSNFVGLQNAFILTSFIYLIKNNDVFTTGRNKIISNIIVLLMLVSLCLTFSRSAILGFFIFLVFLFFRGKKLLKFAFILFLPLLFLAVAIEFNHFFSNDISFRSKFIIFDLTYNHLMSTSLYNVFFGVGLGNAVNYIGMGAHSLALTLLIELGILGLFFFSVYIFYLALVFKYDFNIVVLPFVIISFSLGSTAIPYFFVVTIFLVLVRRNKVSFY
ncbi:hypothetical protein [Vibrio diabolicus]|uniref:hypothetical protein n=1 Tax=Vibrio diabolicus TaxID=50719 RepID=UPI00062BF5B5|nr:hypothetical protein [Vibrio diabolicus]